MKVYDISQEVFGCAVYPGDPKPEKRVLCDMKRGDLYNLSAFEMCAHNGTHVDAPLHFFENGAAVDAISLEKFVGACAVIAHGGLLAAEDARRLLQRIPADCAKRILIKGKATVGAEAAQVFADAGVLLLGCEPQTVGPEEAPMQVHKILLSKGVVLLEGIRLDAVSEGNYLLCAAPLNLAGADGAPCRAVLIQNED